MRHALFAILAFFALLASSSTFAAEPALSPGSDNAQTAPSNEARTRHPDNGKQVAKARPKKPAPASLSAAESGATRTIELPAASSHATSPSADTSWTGFHVGVEGGLAK